MSNKKTKIALGVALTSMAAVAGAAVATIFRQKQREKVYHEAEIKAMNELDDLMVENECECEDCTCDDECECDSECSCGCSAEQQVTIEEITEDDTTESDEEIVEDAADEAIEEEKE